MERPRREEAREQAGLGRVLGREVELGPEKGLGWVFLGRALGNGGLTGFGFRSNSYSNQTNTFQIQIQI